MRPIKLLNLLARNAKRGEFRAEGNTIYLYDVIVGSDAEAEFWGGVSPEAFARQLGGMTGAVDLRINSPGGEVFAARAIAQAMREYGGEITAHVDGLAASAATFVAAAAARVVMAPGSFFMIHNAWTLAMGNADELRAQADLLSKIDVTIADTYAAKAGKPATQFTGLMSAETWFTAEEAVSIGLADEVAQAPAKAKNAAWDLTAFEHPPAASVEPAQPPELDPANPVREEPAQPELTDPPAEAVAAVAENERRGRIAAATLLLTAA